MPCSICLKSKRWWQTIRKLKCGHKFHLECIVNWSNVKQSCPNCRAEILKQKPLDVCEAFLAQKLKHPNNLTIKDVLFNAGIEN